jgi:hypothetical protein
MLVKIFQKILRTRISGLGIKPVAQFHMLNEILMATNKTPVHAKSCASLLISPLD